MRVDMWFYQSRVINRLIRPISELEKGFLILKVSCSAREKLWKIRAQQDHIFFMSSMSLQSHHLSHQHHHTHLLFLPDDFDSMASESLLLRKTWNVKRIFFAFCAPTNPLVRRCHNSCLLISFPQPPSGSHERPSCDTIQGKQLINQLIDQSMSNVVVVGDAERWLLFASGVLRERGLQEGLQESVCGRNRGFRKRQKREET